MKKVIFGLIGVLGMCFSLKAQDKPSIIYYHGLGRAVIGSSSVDESSNFMANDTTSDKRDLSGQFLFDLSTNIEPNKQLRINSILRVTNEFGGFFSQGSALEFRQVRIYGVVANKVAYQIGDIDLQMTPFTLHNNDEMSHAFESSIFSQRRDIVQYENFNHGNTWRLQGAQANFSILPTLLFDEIKFDAFGTRVRQTDYLTTPDRLMTGGTVSLIKNKTFEAKGHGITLFDVAGTSPDTIVDMKNTVVSGEVRYKKEMNQNQLEVKLEGGRSLLKGTDLTDEVSASRVGGYLDSEILYHLKNKNANISIGFSQVTNDFFAAGAQSRRIFIEKENVLFPSGLNGVNRGTHVFDRLTDLSLYNQTITTGLMAYHPLFNNVLPYGKATPNRKGLNFRWSSGHTDSLVYTSIKGVRLSEVEGEGVAEKRQFILIEGGVKINAKKAFSMQRKLNATLGVKYEQSTRSGIAAMELNSATFDAGIEWEIVKALDLIAGMKLIKGSGNEFTKQFDAFNQIIAFDDEIKYEQTQSVSSIALRYRFSDYNFLSFSGNLISVNDKIQESLNYQFKQWFVNYTLKF